MKQTRTCALSAKRFCLCCVLCLAATSVISQDSVTVLYRQKAQRDDRAFFHFLRSRKGFVVLTSDSLLFKSKSPRNAFYNFGFGYCELKSVRTWYGYLFPDRIRIKTKNAGAVRLFTYKRRKLIHLIRERMAACAKP